PISTVVRFKCHRILLCGRLISWQTIHRYVVVQLLEILPVLAICPPKAHSRHGSILMEGRAMSRCEGDASASDFIAEQDQVIATKSGLPAVVIKSVRRSGRKG